MGADGQQRNTPELLVTPKNRSLTFLGLKDAHALSQYWRDQAEHPLQRRWWQEAGFNASWFPIGWAPKFSVALCVSTKVGRVLRFTTPDAQVSHTAVATQHLADSLECYFQDLDDHFCGARQPFILGPAK